MKILLSFVGEQDPVSDITNEEGSIVTLCRRLMPDEIYLYPTASGETTQSETQTRADWTHNWITTEISSSIRVRTEPLALSDPTDFGDILPLIHRALKKRPELKEEGCEIHLNCSSGTPQMKSTWLIIANSGLLPGCRLWQVMNPKFAVERVKEIQIGFLEEENILNRLAAFAKQFLFAQMAEEMGRLRNISLFPGRRERARFLQRLFWVYQDWDMIKYKKAYAGDKVHPGLQELAAVFKPAPGSPEDENLANILMKQVSLLEKLQRGDQKETPQNLSDLYYNACRCFARGNYTDTLARFWRVYEGILYLQLRRIYGIEPAHPDKSYNQTNLNILYLAAPGFSPNVALGVRRAEDALRNAFHDETFKELTERSFQTDKEISITVGSVLTNLRNARNNSISAHGMKPVEKLEAANALKVMRELFTVFFPTQFLEQYPFQYSTLKTVIEYMTKSFSV